MTSKERLLRCIRGEGIDRLPCSPRLWKFVMHNYPEYTTDTMLQSAEDYGWDLHHGTSIGVRTYFGPGLPSAESLPDGVTFQGDVETGDDYDIIRRRFATPAGELTDAWHRPHPNRGYGISPAPTPTESLVQRPEDLDALKYLRGDVMPDAIDTFVESYEKVGDNGYLYPYVRSPFNDLYRVIRMDEALVLPYDDPVLLTQLLAQLQLDCLDDINAHIQAGADSVFISGFHNSLSVGWSPSMFREIFLPLIKEQADLVHNLGALYHYYDDGRVMGILAMMLEAGVDVFETCTPYPAGDFDLKGARDIVGDRMTLMGYTDIENVLHRGTADLVEENVREACEVLGSGGRFIIGSSDGVLEQTPVENMKTYFAAARKYGTEALA